MKIICAFTGYRPGRFPWKYNEADPRCQALQEALTRLVEDLISRGVTGFLTGMAQGVDLWGAQSVLECQKAHPEITLQAVLPCRGQEQKWPEKWRRLYQEILARTSDCALLGEEYTPSCMMERNRYLVDHADLLLAVYDGKARTGTGATVNMAKRKGLPLVILNPDTLEVTVYEEENPQLILD